MKRLIEIIFLCLLAVLIDQPPAVGGESRQDVRAPAARDEDKRNIDSWIELVGTNVKKDMTERELKDKLGEPKEIGVVQYDGIKFGDKEFIFSYSQHKKSDGSYFRVHIVDGKVFNWYWSDVKK